MVRGLMFVAGGTLRLGVVFLKTFYSQCLCSVAAVFALLEGLVRTMITRLCALLLVITVRIWPAHRLPIACPRFRLEATAHRHPSTG